jgi:hypothetical protein
MEHFNKENLSNLYPDIICPITHEIMTDPYTANGISFEKNAIFEWIKHKNICPITKKKLTKEMLSSNISLKNLIESLLNSSIKPSIESSIKPSIESLIESSMKTTVDEVSIFNALNTKDLLSIDLNLYNDIYKNTNYVFLVDNSGSMNSEIIIKDASNSNEENSGLSYLDLVKHCLITFISSIPKTSIITLITFNSCASIIFENIYIQNTNISELIKLINNIKPCGRTNIWDAITLGYNTILNNHTTLEYSKQVILFTDGIPNINPPRGIVNTFEKYIKINNISDIPLHTLGFGYDLDLNVLLGLSKLSKGTFNYIPSSGEMGTVMIHLISNLLLINSTNSILEITYPSTLSIYETDIITKYLKLFNYDINNNILSIYLGQLRYKQKINIMLQNIDINPCSIIFKYTNKNISYSNTIPITNIEQSPTNDYLMNYMKHYITSNIYEIYNDIVVNEVTTSNDMNEIVFDNLIIFIDNFNKNLLSSEYSSICNLYKEHLLDQVHKGLFVYFNKWGKYYIISFLYCLNEMRANNFRDNILEIFTNDNFNTIRDNIENIYLTLPSPIPSLPILPSVNSKSSVSSNVSNITSFVSSIKNKIVSSSSSSDDYNVLKKLNHGGCFMGSCLVSIPNGYKKIEDLRKNDIIINNNIESIIECIIKLRCPNNITNICHFESGLKITPWHPIKINNEWIFPNSLIQSRPTNCAFVYNIILNNRNSIIIHDLKCCTLAHGLQGNVIEHEFFGTEKIIQNLKTNFTNEYDLGLIQSISIIERNIDTDEICGYK